MAKSKSLIPATGLPVGVLRAIWILLPTAVFYQVLVALVMGNYEPRFVTTSAAVLVASLVACCLPFSGRRRRTDGLVLAGFAIVLFLAYFVWAFPEIKIGHTRFHTLPYIPDDAVKLIGKIDFVIAGLTLAAVALAWQGWRNAAIAVVAVASIVFFSTALWISGSHPATYIDVWLFNCDGANAFANGHNPYAITFQNIYAPLTNDSSAYSAGIQKNGRVLFGYPYPPLCLMTFMLLRPFTSDPRYTIALMIACTPVVTAIISGGRRLALIAAGLLIMYPAAFWLVDASYTDPIVLLGLALVAFAGTRLSTNKLAIALGIFLSIKQYNVIFLPFLFLILPRPLTWRSSGKFLAIIIATGSIISLPLALWNWPAFWNSNVYIQAVQPFRMDSFSFLAMYARHLPKGSPPPSSLIAFFLLLPTWALLLWRLPRNVAGFVLGVATTMIVFLLFNRQSFLNYHSFAAGALLIAVAAFEGVYSTPSAATVIVPADVKPE